ncbi:MAG: HNH endonuclease signature motif containing protein, partial [Bacteroidales bacterium]|nr:HNH endonuclease signature motif containing protein [Bacteroidales bacterium]
LASLPDNELIEFVIYPQNRLNGERGYINSLAPSSTNKKSFTKWDGYDKFRKFLLPIISSIQIYKLEDVETNEKKFYWRPYPDFESMANINRLLVLFYSEEKFKDPAKKEKLLEKYRKKATSVENNRRNGQAKYRHSLIEDFKECPVTHIQEPNLLIASHIKPWAVCEDNAEKYNPMNGLLLSPLIDKLFDKGYITFSQQGKIVISPLLNENDKQKISLNTKVAYIDDEKLKNREEYLTYHQKYVFRGKYEE